MYDREARQKLAADPALGLTHFYQEPHRRHFVEELGIEVTGAGIAQANGWYHRREVAEGPPRPWKSSRQFIRRTRGRPWFEKDNGYHIYYSRTRWRCRNSN